MADKLTPPGRQLAEATLQKNATKVQALLSAHKHDDKVINYKEIMPLGNDLVMMTVLDLIVSKKNDEMLKLFGREGCLLRMVPEYYPNRMDKKYEEWYLPLRKVFEMEAAKQQQQIMQQQMAREQQAKEQALKDQQKEKEKQDRLEREKQDRLERERQEKMRRQTEPTKLPSSSTTTNPPSLSASPRSNNSPSSPSSYPSRESSVTNVLSPRAQQAQSSPDGTANLANEALIKVIVQLHETVKQLQGNVRDLTEQVRTLQTSNDNLTLTIQDLNSRI